MAPPLAPAWIEPDDDVLIVPTFASHWPKKPSRPALTNIDVNLIPPPSYSIKLQDLDREELLQGLYFSESTHLYSDNDASNTANDTNFTNKTDSQSNSCPKLERMTKEDIIAQLHHPGTTLPPICPSDCPNGSNTKLLWMPEELHRITGCCHFCNNHHIINASKDRQLVDTGEFLISLGLYTTILKAPRGKAIDWMLSPYLDIVHIDIAFGDCAPTGCYKYTLIFIDHTTWYNWMFGLKSHQHKDILAAFLAFRDEAGSLACQFHCDCDEKHFGTTFDPSSIPTNSLLHQVRPGTNQETALLKHIGK
jgi:hypothetical protein